MWNINLIYPENLHFVITLNFILIIPEEVTGPSPGGVLRYISDGDVRSPFFSLKFVTSEDFFGGWNFVVTFFGWEILVRTFLGVDKKRNPGFSFLCQTIVSVSFTKERWTQKLSGILLNYCYYSIFLIGLFLGYVLGHWTIFGPGSSLKDFFWV